jgi:hypothetical protein
MDDLARRVDDGFARTDREIVLLRTEVGALRTEMREGFRDVRAEFKGEIDGLRTEFKSDIGRLEGNIGELRTLIFRFGVAFTIGLLGLVATLVGAIVAGTLSA